MSTERRRREEERRAGAASDDDRVVMHAALVEHTHGLACVGAVKSGDAAVALVALLVDVHIDTLHA
eukprot:CAMPEP_0171133348 /NCGR_PEP_ID=MMETSP0766_2-20121228/126138_1 /TAXON_ID=439317 /ORGANISM="Gambierdiscus australes, Strain CAWD 149" /LENGTH=65 /DNA_ID=CAMNT_0011596723 /DNA_START=71 /DNA_END=265 /DNA_ORIENTATION=+